MPMDVLELTAALIERPTPNPPGEERPLAEYLAETLTRLGLEAEVLPVQGGTAAQANVFARLPGARPAARRPLVFCGHMDTVPPGEGAWTRRPYRAEVDAGRLYGLGASDMKGAVAAMVVAAGRLAAGRREGRPLDGDLLLAFTSGEETRSLGAQSLAASGRLDGAGGLVIGEPTENRVGIAEKGGIWLEIVLNGHTAHGSLPHLGANAIAGMAEVLYRLERPDGADAVAGALHRAMDVPDDPLLGRPTLTATRIAGGVANNVVPDRAAAILDVRTLPGQSHGAVRAAIAAIVEHVASRRGLRPELADHGERLALATPDDHPLVLACVAAATDALGRPPGLCGLTGATDATEIAPVLGLPFVICGPGAMAQAHQPDEFVAVAPLQAAVTIYERLARSLLA
jgi:succinyl-diaminopimelate desuccinylase